MKLSLQATVEYGLRHILNNPKLIVIGLIFGLLVSLIDYAIMGGYTVTEISELFGPELVAYFNKAFMKTSLGFLISVFFYAMMIKISYDAMQSPAPPSRKTRLSRKSLERKSTVKSMEGILPFVLKKYLILLFAYILSIILVMCGLVLLIVPGVYVCLRLMFFPFAVIIDNEGVIGSLKKSWKISEDRIVKLFAILLVIIAITFGLALLVSLLTIFSPFSQQILVQALVYAIEVPWVLSSMMYAYTQLKKRR